MTDKLSPQSSRSASLPQSLSYEGIYPCPVCRHGQIQALLLTEAFACNFCRHIFTVDLTDSSLRVEDSSQPLRWRWTGRGWQSVQPGGPELSWMVWIVGAALVLLPPSLIWVAQHTFPPAPGSSLSFFPLLWTALTFLAHLSLVGWLLVEYYQLPLYVVNRLRLGSLLTRRTVSRR